LKTINGMKTATITIRNGIVERLIVPPVTLISLDASSAQFQTPGFVPCSQEVLKDQYTGNGSTDIRHVEQAMV
jgi:hypothetical protein